MRQRACRRAEGALRLRPISSHTRETDPEAKPPVSNTPPGPAEPRARRTALKVGGVVVFIAVAIWANLYAAEHDLARDMAIRLGYPGIFLAAAASGFNLVVPVPLIAFYPFFMELGFDPVLTVAVIAVGMTTGDLVGYLIGRATRAVMAPRAHRMMARLESLRERHRVLPFVVMFLYAAFAPIPNELLVIPLAFMRYPLIGIFTAVLAGNLIFNSLVAFGILTAFNVF